MHLIGVLITFFVFTNFGFAQPRYFNGLPVDTVEITSSSGHYHFDESGTTTVVHDSYIIAFNKEDNNYLTEYKRTRIKLTIHPETEERKQGKTRARSFNDEGLLDSLFTSLTVRYKPFSVEQLGLSEQDIINIIQKKRILRIAKAYNQDWQFKHKYSTRSQNERIFRGCRKIDTVKLFLDSFKVNLNGYVLVSDYSDEMYIRIISRNKTFNFEGKYPNMLKLPWYDRSDTSVFVKTVFNFDINRYLTAMLPTYFYRKKTIDKKALLNNYIVWYLKRREIIWDYK